MKIYMVGMTGAGKTTEGNKLANRMHIPFYDTDEFIESHFGVSIKQLLEEGRESELRDLEYSALSILSHVTFGVVSTGGGIVEHKPSIEMLKKQSLIIHVEVDYPTLFFRVVYGNQGKFPPGRIPITDDELKDRYDRRMPLYRGLAHLTIQGVDKQDHPDYGKNAIFAEALELFEGDEEAARSWFTTEQSRALGGRSPQQAVIDGDGQRVRRLIANLEHGNYI